MKNKTLKKGNRNLINDLISEFANDHSNTLEKPELIAENKILLDKMKQIDIELDKKA